MKYEFFPFIVILCIFFITGCSTETVNPEIKKNLLMTEAGKSANYSNFGLVCDASGRVEVTYYYVTSDLQSHNTVSVTVPEDSVCIGGGASVDYADTPTFLTGSWPDNDLTTWNAQSKDHIIYSYHVLKVLAVGLRLKGDDGNYIPRDVVKSHFYVTSVQSESDDTPNITSYDSTGILVGYGAQVVDPFYNWGSLLTTCWSLDYISIASSKPHIYSDAKSIISYGIRYDNGYIDGFGYIETNHLTPGNGIGYPRAMKNTNAGESGSTGGSNDEGWIISCPGAASFGYSVSSGRMLTGMMCTKYTTKPNMEYVTVSDSDLIVPSAGTLYAYFIQIRKRQ